MSTVTTLPEVTVARFEEVSKLIEELVVEKADVFVSAQQTYRDRHREGSSRQLRPEEAAQIAAGLAGQLEPGASLIETAVAAQQSDLRAYDEPAKLEVLVAAGLAVVPALLHVARLLVALIELDEDELDAAWENEQLRDVLEERAATLGALPMGEARDRARAALEHFAEASGLEPQHATRLAVDTVTQAFRLAAANGLDASGESSLIGGDSHAPEPDADA